MKATTYSEHKMERGGETIGREGTDGVFWGRGEQERAL